MTGRADKQAQEEKSSHKMIREIHKGRIISVIEESMKIHGVDRVHDLVIHPGAVAVVAVDDKSNLVLVRQWRRAVQQILLELPAGTLEPGEPVAQCAQRELQEETGFMAKKMTLMGMIHTCPGFCNERIYLFLGQDLEFNPLPADDNEAIDVVHISMDEINSMIDQGTITDSKTIAALTYYTRWIEKNNR